MDAKRMFRRFLWVLGVGLSVAAVSTAPASDMGMAAANQVSQSSIYDYMDIWLYTHTGSNRGVGGAQHNLCRDSIATLMTSYGLTVTLEPFTYNSVTYHNVVGTKLGSTFPESEYVVGSHYDSVSNPGADDNASGVALVLECARIISQYDSDYTIRFVAFSREEQGLIGSEAYVAAHGMDDIRGMLEADMVAYCTAGNTQANVYRRPTSPIADALQSSITLYSNGLTPYNAGWISASDHASFDAGGFDAGLLIEYEVWSNPYYHTSQDTFEQAGNLSFPYAVKMTRAMVGCLVDKAGVIVDDSYLKFVYPAGRPQYCSPDGGTTVRVEVSGVGTSVPQPGTGLLYYNVGTGWLSTPMVVVSANVYDAVLPAATCGSTVQYYVTAQAVGGEIFKNPPGAPTGAYTAVAAYGVTTFYQNNFDTDPGWTTQTQWAFGHPTGGGGQYGGPDPTNGHTGTNVYGYNLAGDYANSLPETHLTSTAINCTGKSQVHLNFWRWLGVEQPTYDHAYVRVSNNGTTWTTIWQNASEVADTSWHQMDLDISAVADNKPTVYLRWTMGQTDTAWQYCGWNVDDVSLTALNCTPPTGACCQTSGACSVTTQSGCTGTWQGAGTTCTPNPCPPPPTGACCQTGGACSVTTQAGCTGTWQGAGTNCSPNPCSPQVCRGNSNCDTAINWRDIDYFVAAMGDNVTAWQAMFAPGTPSCPFANNDVNADGTVNWRDIDPFVAVMGTTCP